MPTNEEIWAEVVRLRTQAYKQSNILASVLARLGLVLEDEAGNLQLMEEHMSETAQGNSSIELDLKNKTAKLTGNDIFTIVGALATVALAVGGWFHHKGQEEGRAEFVAVLKESAAATRSSAQAQREQNCLMRFATEERQKWVEFCRAESAR